VFSAGEDGLTCSCPDEGDRCIEQSPVGGQCQKDRDDECARAPDYKDLAGYLNVNGSICLDFTCQCVAFVFLVLVCTRLIRRWANVSVGQTCIFENTRYQAYTDTGTAYAFIVSRDK